MIEPSTIVGIVTLAVSTVGWVERRWRSTKQEIDTIEQTLERIETNQKWLIERTTADDTPEAVVGDGGKQEREG